MVKKKIFSKVMLLFLCICSIFLLGGSVEATENVPNDTPGTVHVTVENTTLLQDMVPRGVFVDMDVEIDSSVRTMMDAIQKALEMKDIPCVGADEGYISSINGISAFDGGYASGWMGTLNDWFTNVGFSSIPVEAGDEIRVMYTCAYGADIGGGESTEDNSLKEIVFGEGIGTLTPDFSSDVYAYTLELPEDTSAITVYPTAANKQYQVRTYLGEPDVKESGYKRSDLIPVYDGDVITVVCGDWSWATAAETRIGKRYTFTIKSNLTRNHAPVAAEGKSDTIQVNTTYQLDLNTVFTDEDNDLLTYKVSVNGAEETDTEAVYSFTPERGGNYELSFWAEDGRARSKAYVVRLTVEDGEDYSIEIQEVQSTATVKTDVEKAKLGTAVTIDVTVKNGSDQTLYCLESLKIYGKTSGTLTPKECTKYNFKTKMEGGIEEVTYTYTFVMPAEDVQIEYKISEAILLDIQYFDYQVATNVELRDSEGELVPLRKYDPNLEESSLMAPVAEGAYSYTVYRQNKLVTRTGELEVSREKANDDSIFRCFKQNLVFRTINFKLGSSNVPAKDSEKYYRGIVPVVRNTADGKELEPAVATYVTYGRKPRYGYTIVNYIVEAREGDTYQYEVKPADPGLTLTATNKKYSTIGTCTINPIDLERSGSIRSVTYKESIANFSTSFKVSKGADFKLYSHTGNAYSEWKELKPSAEVDTSSDSKYDIYKYETAPLTYYCGFAGGGDTKYVKTAYGYQIKEPEYVWDLEPKTDRREAAPSWRSPADDLYTNIKDDGYCLNMAKGDTQKLECFRVWQTVSNSTTNVFMEPDLHYKVYGNSVRLSDVQGGEGRKYVNIEAVGEGVSFIAITYDSCSFQGNYFNPIDPIYTGLVIVNVDGTDEGISTGISQTKYDTIYYKGTTTYPDGSTEEGKGYGEYTFRPESIEGEVSVSVHQPVNVNSSFTDSDWEPYPVESDGSCTIHLTEGRNIVRISSGTSVRYYALNARKSDVTIENDTNSKKMPEPGDTLSVSFSGIDLPLQKMAGVYNPGYPGTTYLVYELNGKEVEGKHTQYDIVNYNTITFTVDAYEDYRLDNGRIHAQHMGSPLDAHCNIPTEGLPPNMSASGGENKPEFCTLPDVTISVKKLVPSETFTVTAVSSPVEGGTAKAELVKGDDKEAVWKLTAEAKEGYEFTGWAKSTDKDNTILSKELAYEVPVKELTEDTSYTAVYKKKEPGKPTEPDKPAEPDKETTLTYGNYPISVTGVNLDNCRLVLTPLEAADGDVKLMQSQISSNKVLFRLYDVKLLDKNNQEIRPEGTIKLGFQVGNGYNGQSLIAMHVLDNGSVEKLRGTVAGEILTVQTDRLGKFGVVADSEAQSGVLSSGIGSGALYIAGNLNGDLYVNSDRQENTTAPGSSARTSNGTSNGTGSSTRTTNGANGSTGGSANNSTSTGGSSTTRSAGSTTTSGTANNSSNTTAGSGTVKGTNTTGDKTAEGGNEQKENDGALTESKNDEAAPETSETTKIEGEEVPLAGPDKADHLSAAWLLCILPLGVAAAGVVWYRKRNADETADD